MYYIHINLLLSDFMLGTPKVIGMGQEAVDRSYGWKTMAQLEAACVSSAYGTTGGPSSCTSPGQEGLNEWFNERCPGLWLRSSGFECHGSHQRAEQIFKSSWLNLLALEYDRPGLEIRLYHLLPGESRTPNFPFWVSFSPPAKWTANTYWRGLLRNLNKIICIKDLGPNQCLAMVPIFTPPFILKIPHP